MTGRRALAAVLASIMVALAAVQFAAGAAVAPRTTEPVRLVPINVTVTAARVKLDMHRIGFQNMAQFRIRNRTAIARTFSIGGQKMRVAANGYRIMLLFCDVRGSFRYTVTPGSSAHRGTFLVI
jgi:hypothetical protein